jgi:hypothetical protein
MNKVYALIAIISIFIAGYFAGKRSADNHWHIINEKELQQYNQQLSAKMKVNDTLIESYNKINSQYELTLKDKQNVLEKNKELINANNRITKQLVQYIQSSKPKATTMQGHDTESTIDSNATIPAVDFGIWAAGLVTHDQQCINQLSSIIKAINNGN